MGFNSIDGSRRLSEEDFDVCGGDRGGGVDQNGTGQNSSGRNQVRFSVGDDFIFIQVAHDWDSLEFSIHEISG